MVLSISSPSQLYLCWLIRRKNLTVYYLVTTNPHFSASSNHVLGQTIKSWAKNSWKIQCWKKKPIRAREHPMNANPLQNIFLKNFFFQFFIFTILHASPFHFIQVACVVLRTRINNDDTEWMKSGSQHMQRKKIVVACQRKCSHWDPLGSKNVHELIKKIFSARFLIMWNW